MISKISRCLIMKGFFGKERKQFLYTTLFAKIGSRIKTEERKTLTNN